MDTNPLWIIGIGNRQRRDDGIGPYVAERLERILRDRDDVRIQAQGLLDPVLMEDLKGAARVVFVDATALRLPAGWRWTEIEPRDAVWPLQLHDLPAPTLLALLQALYGCRPVAWMVAVQGEDFDLGEGLSRKAQYRADRVVEEIATLADQEHIE